MTRVYVTTCDEQKDIEITGISLLSVDEYKAAQDHIPLLMDQWWLRTPGYSITGNPEYGGCYVACVESVCNNGDRRSYIKKSGYLATSRMAVRPVLKLNRRLLSLHIDDRFLFADHAWVYIGKGLAICEDALCKMPFRIDWQAEDQNVFEWSDVSAYLEKWLSDALAQYNGGPKAHGTMPSDWIPFSRYSHPKEDGETLVTIRSGGTTYVTSSMFRLSKMNWDIAHKGDITGWMQHPAPYKG